MAKQIVGPIEQHVEKAVFALGGIALIAVGAMYLVTSPNQVELDGQMVSPTTIDGMLARKAADVRRAILGSEPSEEEFEPLAGAFVEGLDPFESGSLSLELAAGVMIGPEVPIIDPPGVTEGNRTLVEVQRLDKPAVVFGRSTFVFDAGDALSLEPANWVTVSAVFNREEQVKLQSRAYGSQRSHVIFGAVELQRRARRPDGTWSDDDWELVDAWPTARIPKAPGIQLLEEDGRIVVPREDRSKVERYQEEVNEPNVQLTLLRPLMPEVYNGTPWKFPQLVPYPELLRQDDDYLNSTRVEPTPQAELEDRYLLREEEPVIVEKKLTPGQEIDLLLQEGERLLARGKAEQSSDDAIDAQNIFVDVSLSKDATPAQQTKAKRKIEEAEQLFRDIERRERRRGSRKAGRDEEDEEKQRELQPRQQLWAHDSKPGSVKSGTTYQYRIRANLYNRLAAEPAKFKDPGDARVFFASGEWSQPSDPIAIEPVRRFFVTGYDPRKKTIKVEMYRWFDGVWVTGRESLSVGDRLAFVRRVEVQVPDDPDAVDRPEVSFEADATVVSIDFKRRHRERKKTRGGGARFQPSVAEACSVVFVDSKGELEERFVPTDKNHPDKKMLQGRVWRAPKKRR